MDTFAPRCPRCSTALRAERHDGARLWRCDGCGASAVPISWLRRDRDAAIVSELWAQARAANATAGQPCAACARGTARVKARLSDGELTVDVCVRCQLAAFAAGDLDRIPTRPRPANLATDQLPPEAKAAYAQALASAWTDRIRDENRREATAEGIETTAKLLGELTSFFGS